MWSEFTIHHKSYKTIFLLLKSVRLELLPLLQISPHFGEPLSEHVQWLQPINIRSKTKKIDIQLICTPMYIKYPATHLDTYTEKAQALFFNAFRHTKHKCKTEWVMQ